MDQSPTSAGARSPTGEARDDSARSTRTKFVDRLRKLRDEAEEKVRENPLAALGVAFGAGLLLGLAPRRGIVRAALFVAGRLLVGDAAVSTAPGATTHGEP